MCQRIRRALPCHTHPMPEQQDALVAVLERFGFRSTVKPPRLSRAALPRECQVALRELYHELGGVQTDPNLLPGGWDSCFEPDLIVEYDESQHFNRYRALTFKTKWAAVLPWRRSYVDFCGQFEDQCLKSRGWGGYWTNASSERMFAAAGPAGSLDEGAGSPRWKQRALYDAIRDAAAAFGVIRLARLAVHDDVGGVTLGRALSQPALVDRDALVALVTARTLTV